MEFFNQNKENQRTSERFVMILYSLYTLSLCVGAVKLKWDAWVPVVMMALLAAGWGIFLTKYRNIRLRAMITTVMMQLTVILYAAKTDNLSNAIPIFLSISVLIAIYGYSELLWGTIVSLLFMIFYHCVVVDTVWAMPGEARAHLFYQLGNIFSVEFVLYVWLKFRKERNEQVHKIIEALMDAEQSKDDFLANVSHEIRTPVNTICGMSEMALREHDLEKMREEVYDIRDAGHNLMSLVTDILDFSQLQQGKMNLEEEAYNITSTINDIINVAMARKGDKQIELIVDCDANIPSGLFGDEKKIRRVIMNLVDNAIKFTNEGGVIIRIYTRKENYGVNLCISVRDTGIGIAEESLEKLFESFSQVDTRRNRQEGGVGLGLAISKALVQKMGGTITVKSRLGRGSTFRFVVPQKVLDEKPIGEVENREKLNIAAYFDMEQFDMMTIRDEYTNLIANMVRQLRVRCHACRNLAELMRREANEAFTHIFISLEEYQEDEAYFDALAKTAKIIIVIDRPREKYLSNPDMIRLYKPFYILPVVSILNGSSGSEGGKQMVRPGKFIAPDAHVLVVDDNRMNIRVVEGLLKEYQIKVTYATSGQEALQVIENMAYDFVFMDHMMPEMDGVETLHRIRDKVGHYYQKVPIIALTANAAPGNREMFLEEGFDDFVSKPLEVSVLERVLRRNLPEEKIIFTTGNDAQEKKAEEKAEEKPEEKIEEKPTEKPREEVFAIGDLDVEKGMLYCGGREEYIEILAACYEEKEENRSLFTELLEKQDWTNYTIKVHALKSMMQNIGASPLSAKARELEMAGKKNDIDYIMKNHEDMLAEYERVMAQIRTSPLVPTKEPEAVTEADGAETETADMPELSEDEFDSILTGFEDAVYALDGEKMMTLLSDMQNCRYHHAALAQRLDVVKKKVEMTDYMSALDALANIREKLREETERSADIS
ncbi:MAG: ATP-binding protein [Bacillus sp. (in: Bacteria)]|nr:ATP-binding protein [Bacillus sp. (in: firmicutes)]MCM1426573.1 ATP-binding protein [Eubacterium sp.]